MTCPICGHPIEENTLRCPGCKESLTVWKNLDMYAQQAHAAGLHCLGRDQPEAALEMLLRAIIFAPNEPAYLSSYGGVLGQLGRYHESAAVLEKACELDDGEDLKTALEMANALADETTAAADETQRPCLALGGVELDLEQEVTDTKTTEHKATDQEATDQEAGGSEDDGLDEFWQFVFQIERDWHRFAPFAPLVKWMAGADKHLAGPAAYLTAVSSYQKGDVERARQLFQRASSQTTRYCDPLVYVVLLSDPADIASVIDRLRAEGRTDRQIVSILELAANAAPQFCSESLPTFLKHAIELADENREDLCFRLASECHSRETLQEALAVWENAIEAHPSLPIQLLVGDAHGNLNQVDAAEDAYKKAMAEYPDDWQPSERLAYFHEKTQPETSLQLLQEALGLPDLPETGRIAILRLRLRILAGLEHWEKAIRDAEDLLELQPDDVELKETLDALHARAGEETEPELFHEDGRSDEEGFNVGDKPTK